MSIIAIGGLCGCCGKPAPAVVSCKSCGSRVCHKCIDPDSGFCKCCGGARKV